MKKTENDLCRRERVKEGFLKLLTGLDKTLTDGEADCPREPSAPLPFHPQSGRIYRIDPARIVPNPAQPRRRFRDEGLITLADSIRQYGILQPLCLRPLHDGAFTESGEFISEYAMNHTDLWGNNADSVPFSDNTVTSYDLLRLQKPMTFELIAGERRLRAAKLLGLDAVPCLITEADSRQSAAMALVENLQREGLNVFEEASAIASLVDVCRLTQEQVAKRLCVSQSYVGNKLRLLRFTEEEREAILGGNLCERHARALLRIADVTQRRAALCHIVKYGLNVANTEEYIDRLLAKNTEKEIDALRPKQSRVILRDLRLFFNAVDKAVNQCREGGVPVFSQRQETAQEILWMLRIPKSRGDCLSPPSPGTEISAQA